MGCSSEPAVFVGKPPVTESYNEVIVDGIKVYIFKEAVTAPEGIKISLGGWWIWQNLQVIGLLH